MNETPNLIRSIEAVLKARAELDEIVTDADQLVELDKALTVLCKSLGLKRQLIEEGSY